MRNSQKLLLLLAALSLNGCFYVAQPASPQVSTSGSTPVADNYVPEPAPTPQPAPVEYQPPPPEVAPVYDDDLAPYGRWIVYGSYGRCWVPNGTPYGWQPYTVGHWVYADDGSCYWVSEADEVAWGGIVYHYGQWAYTPDQGWIWVPGTTYAPAWVAWRDGGGYCGWAPLPPEACYNGEVSYAVADRYCPPQRFVFVQEGDVNVTRVDERVIRNNTTIINNTTNITNITVVNNRVENHGVAVEEIQRRTGRQVTRVNVADAGSPAEARRLGATGVPVRYSSPAIEQIHTRSAPRLHTTPQQRPSPAVEPDREPAPKEPRVQPRQQPEPPNQADVQAQQRQAQLDKERLENGENDRGGQFNNRPPVDNPRPSQQRREPTVEPRQTVHEPADADQQHGGEPNRPSHPANEEKPKQKAKPKPGQSQENSPPQ
jgi:hypothetical protein